MAIIGGSFNSFASFGVTSTTSSGATSSPLAGVPGATQALDLSQVMLQALSLLSGSWGSMLGGGGDNYASLEALGTPLSSQYAGITGVTDVNTMIAEMGGLPSSLSTTGDSFANLDSSYYTQLMSGFDSQLNAAMAQSGVSG